MSWGRNIFPLSKSAPALSRAGISISSTIIIGSVVSRSFSVIAAPSLLSPFCTAKRSPSAVAFSVLAVPAFAAGAGAALLYAAMNSMESLSIFARSLYALTAPVIAATLGLMIGRSRPLTRHICKKLLLISSRFGRPKEIFDTPRTVLSPSSVFTLWRAFTVSITPSC